MLFILQIYIRFLCGIYVLYMFVYYCLLKPFLFIHVLKGRSINFSNSVKKSAILLFNVREPPAWLLLSLWGIHQSARQDLSSAWQILAFTFSPCWHCLQKVSHRFLCLTCMQYHQHDSCRFLSSALTIINMIRPGILLNISCSVFCSLKVFYILEPYLRLGFFLRSQ